MDKGDKAFLAASHQKFSKFRELTEELGPEKAREKMLEGYPERQQRTMGPFIAEASLAEGFTKAIPFFERIGMEMVVVDISNKKMDAVLEIQSYCPYLGISKEHGFETPCHVICELDVEATRRAFPGMKGEILCRQASGSCVCVFKYERAGK